jgi:peptidyl-tRNA hydrolase ICT1
MDSSAPAATYSLDDDEGDAAGVAVVRPGDLRVTLPRTGLSTAFSRSSGAGGQNVNKLNTKAEVRFHLQSAAWMDPIVRARFAELHGASLNGEGEVWVTSQRHRTQESNLNDALEKLKGMVLKAAYVPKVRMQRTGLSELTKQERVSDKRHRGGVKERRKGSFTFDD